MKDFEPYLKDRAIATIAKTYCVASPVHLLEVEREFLHHVVDKGYAPLTKPQTSPRFDKTPFPLDLTFTVPVFAYRSI